MKSKFNLRVIVLTWTVLTTTFFWTSTMRILFKPEISSWSIFSYAGKGFAGEFWLPVTVLLFALFLFYLEGRGKIRSLFHIMLVSWHLLVTGVIVYGSFQTDAKISFGTWGISMSFLWLVVPFFIFLVLSIVFVAQEIKGDFKIPYFDWKKINWKPLLIALSLFPVAFIFFQLGTGFNWLVKIAVAATIVQWIMITEALGRPYPVKSKQTVNLTDKLKNEQ